jgi:hypothetical protein
MLKRRITFGDSDTDKRLLKAAIDALNNDVLKARYDYTVECDDSTGKVTLYFWQRPTGGFDAK